MTSGTPYYEGDGVEKGPKMTTIIDLESIGLRRSARLANKSKQKYGLFAKFLLAVLGACEVAENTHIFLTIANQHSQEINIHFNGTLNHFGTMLFAENQEEN